MMAIKEGTQLKTEEVTGDSTEAKDEYEPLPGKWLIASLVMRFCKFATWYPKNDVLKISNSVTKNSNFLDKFFL